MARLQTLLTLSLLCLSVSLYSHAQDLPEVDVDALMEQVNALADQLRTEAQRLIDDEGAEKAIERLRAEAKADDSVAFDRMNLAAVVAVLAGDEETAVAVIGGTPDPGPGAVTDALTLLGCVVSVRTRGVCCARRKGFASYGAKWHRPVIGGDAPWPPSMAVPTTNCLKRSAANTACIWGSCGSCGVSRRNTKLGNGAMASMTSCASASEPASRERGETLEGRRGTACP